jgi:multidrug efflux pump subunit AcrB
VGGLTEFALKSSRLTIIFVAAIIGLGVLIYLDYPRQEDPSITVREAIVTASFPGMSPSRVEDLITRPIEQAIRELPEVDEIRSDSKTGVSIVHVALGDKYTELQPIWQRLREKMSDLRAELPEGTNGPAVNDEVGLTSMATIALWTDGFSLAEMAEVAKDLRDALYGLEGIKKVEIFGVQDERIFLDVNNARLAELGIGPAVLIDTLQQQNIILPGGTLDASGINVVLEPTGNLGDLDEIRNVLFTVPATGELLRLGDIAEIERKYVDPPDKPVFYNGKQAIVLSVSILNGINAVAFGEKLKAKVSAFEAGLPVGYALEYATYQPDLIESAVNSAVVNVYQTLAIVLIVVMLFLGVRTGLIVGAIVPLTMLLAIIVMRLLEIELQRISIAAMIIALGLLVDNGIVVVEDIRRRIDNGTPRREAALAVGRTLSLPLLTSSLTTILAFLPMMLSVGAAGEYTRSLSQVIIIVLLGSWFLAMTVTPSLCTWFIAENPSAAGAAKDTAPSRSERFYGRVLTLLLRFRFAFLGSMIVALAIALLLFQGISKEFFPSSDRNQFLVYVDLPAGTSIRETEVVVRDLTTWLSDTKLNPDVASAAGYAGDGGPRFFLSLSPLDPDPHLGFVVVNTKTADGVPALVETVRTDGADRFPQARLRVKPMWLGPSETGLIEVKITGSDPQKLYDQARKVEGVMRSIPGSLNIENNWENPILKLLIEVDQARARRAGVTSQDIANSLASFISGNRITDFRENDLVIPVVIRGANEERGQLATLQSLTIYSPTTGAAVPLPQIASIQPEWQLGRIKRLDQQRTVTVRTRHRTLKAAEMAAILRPELAEVGAVIGENAEYGGELEKSSEAQKNLFAAMPYCLAAIVMLLIWQFNSIRRASIILLTIPLSFVGAVAGLLIMNAPFGFMAILGLFSLAGIIINNGIVLIDRIEEERVSGSDIDRALTAACQARLRPIVMTTVTTVLGLVPLILFGGPLWYGMANVIAFGLTLGTVLTLGVVPVLYSLFFDRARKSPATDTAIA